MSAATKRFRSTAAYLGWVLLLSLAPWQEPDSLAQTADATPISSQLSAGMAKFAEADYATAANLLADVVAKQQAICHELSQDPSRTQQLKTENETLRRAMLGAGSALRQLGRYAEAFEFFNAALDSFGNDPDSQMPTARILPIRLAAAECAFEAGQADDAMRYCEQISLAAGIGESVRDRHLADQAERLWIRAASGSGRIVDAWKRFDRAVLNPETNTSDWQELALSIGLAALTTSEPATAQLAFRWYLKHASEDLLEIETAVLGIAWAAAKGAEPYEVAAERLLDFVNQFPNSPNAPKALLACGGCYQRCDNTDMTKVVYQRVIDQYPNSEESITAVSELLAIEPQIPLSPTIAATLRNAISRGQTTPNSIAAALIVAATENDAQLWSAALNQLLASRPARENVGVILERLDSVDRSNDAERLATQVLSSRQSLELTSIAYEQTCRWAALKNHWGLLRQAGAVSLSENQLTKHSPLTLRLLAEGAVQAGDLKQAQTFLTQLVEVLGNRDFDALLRNAEVQLALASKNDADRAIEMLRQSASDHVQQALAQMLQAQLFIRDARMLDARDTLDQILASTDVVPEVKARARWLIGETYFLQRQFAESIKHYRLVETIDDTGNWTSAALMQAGRAFEQLGKQREAAICYTSLLSRFADCPHAKDARDRLVSLSPQGTGPDNKRPSNAIIR